MYIRLLREAGGLGDVLRLFPVLKGLKEKHPNHRLHFYCLSHYQELVMPHNGGYVDCYVNVNMSERRARMEEPNETKHGYLRRGVKYDHSYEAYCPAFVHEVATEGKVYKERTALWCEHVGVPFSRPVYHVTERERWWAGEWMKAVGASEGEIVCIQPFGTTKNRNWPESNWTALIEYLLGAGLFVVVLDCCGRPRHFPGHKELNRPWDQLGAILKAASLVISGDSGLFHFANAVGTHALGLFGITNGAVLSRAYPDTGHWLSASKWDRNIPDGCMVPCYGRTFRGYNQECRDGGCVVLNSIEPIEVFRKVMEIFPEQREWKEDWDITAKVGKEYYTEAYWKDGTRSGYRGYGKGWPIHRAIAEMMVHGFELKPEHRILDYGGAFGYHAGFVKGLVGCEPYLVDASKHAVENCDPAVKGREQWADVGTEGLKWCAETFDFVMSVEVMEHIYITEVPFAFDEIWRVMKPGALLYASIDVHDFREPRFIDKTHQTMRPMPWWLERFEAAGFKVRADILEKFKAFTSTVNNFKDKALIEKMKWNVVILEKVERAGE